jgi:uncharacterized protein YjiS (DUF1127 family)
MRKSTELESLPIFKEVAPRGVISHRDTPIIISRRGSASNDATCEDPMISKGDVDPWAQHARAANGFGEVATTTRYRQRRQARDMYDALHQLDDRDRSFTLAEIIVAAVQAAAAIARRARAHHRQRRQATAIYDALRQLNDHTLRDLGFHRSETRSVAAEVTREAERTRVRALLTMCGLP